MRDNQLTVSRAEESQATEYFEWPVRVYYEDTDTGKVVYYANYLKFYERARTEFLRALGFSQEQLRHQQSLLFVVASVQAQYKSPARLDDQLTVRTRLQRIARSYLIFEQQIVRRDLPTAEYSERSTVKNSIQEQLLNSAQIQIACVDAQNYRPRALPEELGQILRSSFSVNP